MGITLLQLRTQVRQRADMESSNFVSDSELNNYINKSIAELHDIMVQSYGSDYYVSETTFLTVTQQAQYDLPVDFYKIMGVDVAINGQDFLTIQRFNFNERNRTNNTVFWNLAGIPWIRYRLVGAKLMLSPIPDSGSTIKVWYIPLATELVADGDILDDLNQYSEYVVVDAAIKCMQKEESDVTVLAAEKMGLKQRIEQAAQNRDAGEPESVSDIYSENSGYYIGIKG